MDVQGLRGIAILLVVMYHAGIPFVAGGFIGVDVFFVISGYLITGLLVREARRTGRIRITHFYARRARRLLPAAWMLCAVVAAFAMIVLPPIEQYDVLSATRASALYVANVWFGARAIDYLGGDASANPMLHMWSLAVEEQFYLLWPFLIAGITRFAPADRSERVLRHAIVGLTIVSFVLCVWMTEKRQPWAFFGTPFRAWEFGLGAIAYMLQQQSRRLPRSFWCAICAASGVGLLILGTLALADARQFPGTLALIPAIGTSLVLIALDLGDRSLLSRGLAWRPLAWIGDLSYSWYLWHWPALVFAIVLFPSGGLTVTGVAIALSLSAAHASFRWIENPIRTTSRLVPLSGLVVAAAISGSVGIAIASSLAMQFASSRGSAFDQRRWTEARNDVPRIYELGCIAWYDETDLPACEFGDLSSTRTIVLFGDSHAAHWFAAVEALALRNGWRLIVLVKAACPSVESRVRWEASGQPYLQCDAWREKMFARLDRLKPDLVLIANASVYQLPEQWAADVARTLDRLERSGLPSAWLRDTPAPGFHVPACLARMAWGGRDLEANCGYERKAGFKKGLAQSQAQLRVVADRSSALWIDLNEAVCPAERCPAIVDGTVIFSDSNHLAQRFVQRLIEPLNSALRSRASQENSPIARLYSRD